ncbi:hypothetical protein HK100_002595 [Physocladia obscura]|uniref:F-box domain-containing protein n=1 Tax=Physocladia obscura TaxID=109957 RepID=A0AAD5XA50_9FUNG|nr:hypothetical protein HK100_002595 [Physocladia obscura]
MVVSTASLSQVPLKCLVNVLRQVTVCAQTSKQFAAAAANTSLWRHVTISGSALRVSRFIVSVLIPHSAAIHSISFEGISFAPSGLFSTETIVAAFFASIETLFTRIGSNLSEFRIDDSPETLSADTPTTQSQFKLPVSASIMNAAAVSPATTNSSSISLFGNLHLLITLLAKYCPKVKRIVFSGSEASEYVGDASILQLTQAFPLVESFIDEEACGITPQAITYMAENWKHLQSLEIDTDYMDVYEFHAAVSLLGNRLTNLSITSFVDPLSDDDSFATLLATLQALTSLKVLAVNHSTTRMLDGIDPKRMVRILDACPRLHGFEYFAGIEAYFEFDDVSSVVAVAGAMQSLEESSVELRGADPQALVASWETYRAAVTDASSSGSRRGSIGSMSIMTFSTPYSRKTNNNRAATFVSHGTAGNHGTTSLRPSKPTNLSVFSHDDAYCGYHEDVTSLAPGRPSPTDHARRVEFYGTWTSGDVLTIRARALQILGFEGEGADFFVGKQEVFFALLDGVYAVCRERGVEVTFAWSI